MEAYDNQIKVKIVDMQNYTSTTAQVYLPIGTPAGIDALTVVGGITLTPELLSVSPSNGSPGGSLITALVKGLGSKTTGVSLFASVNGIDVDICASVKMLKYGVL